MYEIQLSDINIMKKLIDIDCSLILEIFHPHLKGSHSPQNNVVSATHRFSVKRGGNK